MCTFVSHAGPALKAKDSDLTLLVEIFRKILASIDGGIRDTMELELVLLEAVLFTLVAVIVMWWYRRCITRRYAREVDALIRTNGRTLARLHRLEQTLGSQQSLFFSFQYEHGKYVHTSCYGTLSLISSQRVVGKALEDIVSPDIAGVMRQYYDKAWQQGIPLRYEIESLTHRHYLCILTPVHERNQVVEVVGCVFDITAQKNVELSLKQSEQRYFRLVDMSPEGIAVLRGRKLVFVNPAAVSILGAETGQELIGKPIKSLLHPADLGEVRQHMRRFRRVHQVIDFGETRFLRQDGSVIHVEVVGVVIRYEQKPAVQFMFRDVTARKQTEELLRRAKTSAIVSEIAAGIAHEIRNPLTVLRGFVQFLKDMEHGYAEYYQLMLEESDRINTIVTDLLALARPAPSPMEPVDVRSVVQTAACAFHGQAALQSIRIRERYEQGRLPVLCDEQHLRQAFTNILQNAFDAMQSGGDLSVQVMQTGRQSVLVEIEDNGPGIAPERLEVIGEPFYGTKEKGIGLGLMISYHIIQQCGGCVDIESEVGRGTKVSVRLPLTEQGQVYEGGCVG